LQYLEIEQQSAPGKQNQLILRLTDTLLEKAPSKSPLDDPMGSSI